MKIEVFPRTVLAILLLPLLLVVSVSGSEGALLCFGKDGHVAIEFVDACSGGGLGSQLACAKSDACGPCKDVQFLSSPAYIRNSSHNTQTLPLMSPSPVSPPFLSEECPTKHINLAEHSPHKTLSCLHSVVLLI